MSRTRSSRRRRATGAALALGVVLLAACGSDSESSATTAAAATTAVATASAGEATTTAAASTAAASASTSAGSTPASTSGGDGFASTDEIAALCADDKPDKLVFSTFAGQQAAMGSGFDGFTAATGVTVEFLENGLSDRLTKMAAEKGSPTIDVALVPINEVPALLDNGIVEPTDTSIPNYDQLLDVAKVDGGYGASILQFGIAYNPEKVTTPPTSWSDLFDAAYAGHIAFPSMPNSGGYAALSMLTRIAGGTDADLTPGVELVAENKSAIDVFYPFSTAIEPQVKSGEVWIYPEIGGSALAAAARDVPVEFVVPEEGGPAGLNTLVIPVGSDHASCAKALVSWYLAQDMQTLVARTLHYGTTSSTPLPADVASSVYPQDLSTLVQLDWPTIAENGPDTLDVWNSKVTG
ncbi:MAG: extracellular solute-binding protein [Ilumatobacteraceae bacterium]